MISKENRPSASSLFAALHPDLSALESAMEELQNAIQKSRYAASTAGRILADVEPVAWLERIEASSNKPEELATIRALYDERVLGFIPYWLSYENLRQTMHVARDNMHHALFSALVAHDDIHTSGENAYLKSIFKARILAVERLLCQKVEEWKELRPYINDNRDTFAKLLDKIQGEAFQKFLVSIGSFSQAQTGNVYFVDPVVPRQSVEKGLQGGIYADHELRNVWNIDFIDDEKSSRPASVKLALLLEKIVPSQSEAWEAEKVLDGWYGGPAASERSHATELLKSLHDDRPTGTNCCSGPDLMHQVKSRNNQRIEGETHRQVLAIHVRSHRALLHELVETLKESAAETAKLSGEVDTVGWWRMPYNCMRDLRTMRNNCLAADASLRHWARNLKSLERRINREFGTEANGRALEKAFAEVGKRYEHSVLHFKSTRVTKP
jgi:hypothetical protein